MQCLESVLAKLAGHYDSRQKSKTHSHANTLLHRFHAREFRDISRTHFLEREYSVELGPITAPRFSEQQCLARKITVLHSAALEHRSSGVPERCTTVRVQADCDIRLI